MNNYFEFDTKAKILSGDGALSHIAYELKIRNKTKPFIMSDKGLESLGITKNAIKQMGLTCSHVLFIDIPVDSSTLTVNQATKIYKEKGCDCVIAVGGGSVIDTAKGVVLSIVSGQDDIDKIEGVDSIYKENNCLFIAAPTTAGTGSETTSVAVIKSAKSGSKLEYISTFILPDISVLDPSLTLSLPAKITASTAIDALTHSIEAYSCLMKNPVSDAYAICAIKLIAENIYKVIENGKDSNARHNLLNAAFLAGAAFSNSMVGAVHSIGHSLGAVSNVAHGDAMCILLVPVMKLNYEKCKNMYGELLYFVNPERFEKTKKEERGKAFIEEVESMLKTLNQTAGIPIKLSQTSRVKKEDFPAIIEKSLIDGSAMVNPVPLNDQRVMQILEDSF